MWLEVVLSLENITLNANLNFKMLYHVSDLRLRTLGGLAPQRSRSPAARAVGCCFIISACSDLVSRMHGQHLAAKDAF